MQTTFTKENGKLVIAIEGRLDTVTSQELSEQLDKTDYTNLDVNLDFTNVEYISSAGLRLIVALQKKLKETGNQLTIQNPNKVVSEIFKVAGFNKVLNIIWNLQ